MKTKYWQNAAVILIICAVNVSAAERSLTLEQCLDLGLANNLRLRNKAIETLIAEAGVSRAEAIYDTVFSVNAQHTDTSIPDAGSFFSGARKLTDISASLNRSFSSGTSVGLSAGYSKYVVPGNEVIQVPPYHGSLSLSVSQSLLRNSFGSLDRDLVEYAEYGRLIAENIYTREQDLLALQIVESYWTLYAAHYNYEDGLASLELAKELLETNRKKLDDGLLDDTDILAAEALIETRNVETLRLKYARDNAVDSLKSIIQLPVDSRDSVEFKLPSDGFFNVANLSFPREILYASALKTRTDVAALSQSIEQADLDAKIKGNSLKPMLDIMGGISRGDTDMSQGESLKLGETSWMIGVKLETPLSRNMAKSDLCISELALEKAKNDLQNLQDAIDFECRTVLRSYQSAYEMVQATTRANKLQTKRLKLERRKFDQGRSDTRWVIEAQDSQIYMRILYHRARADYHKAAAAHRVVQGLHPVRRSK